MGKNNTNAKDERYKGIMRLPHFLRKFAMTEEGRKYEKVIRKIDSRFHGNDRERGKKNNKREGSEDIMFFLYFTTSYNISYVK